MRRHPLSPVAVLRALELFAPQARPYNFDDCFDCWGLVRRVFDHLDDGFEMDAELQGPGGAEEAGWQAFGGPDELRPGDLLVTHAHVSEGFHTAFFCGRAGGLDLVYDASPRGDVPLFRRVGEVWRLQEARALFTRYARATETTDRLRTDGGAYLRLWDDRERYFHRGLRARLLAGAAADPVLARTGGADSRDLGVLRRAAGLSELPFYCRRRLPRDAAGREVYDNLYTRHLDYYVPDGAPVLDDAYEAVMEGGGEDGDRRTRSAARQARVTRITGAPLWIVRDGPVRIDWEYRPAGPVATGCRVEVWEETWDCWKRRILRRDFEEPVTSFTVPEEALTDDSRFAVVVWARGPGGCSGTALAPFLFRPSAGAPLLSYDPIRPEDLAPDGGALLPAGVPADLTWSIRGAAASQECARVEVYEDAGALDGEPPVFAVEQTGSAARPCRVTVPGEVLRAGRTYAWYVTARHRRRRTAFAPSEGVFRISGEG